MPKIISDLRVRLYIVFYIKLKLFYSSRNRFRSYTTVSESDTRKVGLLLYYPLHSWHLQYLSLGVLSKTK